MSRFRFLITAAFASLLLFACSASRPADSNAPAANGSATPHGSAEADPNAAAVDPTTLTPTTELPTATPTSTPTLTPPKTLYQENFEDEVTCFRLHSLDSDIRPGIVDEVYRIEIEGNNSFNTNCIGGYDNFVLEYDVQIAEGDVHSIFGLRFRTYLGSSYNIYFTGSNALCWDYYDADQDSFRNLVGCWWRLPSGLDIREKIRIRLIAAQEKMAIMIDDQIIASVSDRRNDYGTFGFFFANNGPGTTEVVLDNILIRELKPGDTDVFRLEQTG